MKRCSSVFVMVVAMLIASLTAFGVAQQRLVIATVAEASNLDPRTTYDAYSYQRMYAMMEPLIAFAPDLSLVPRLATDWRFAEDGLSITFTLREGVTFHHGKPFTAEDVKYTFEWMLNPDNPAANPGLYSDIERIEVVDDYTVVFYLAQNNSFILNNIARLHIVPSDLGEDENFARNPVGTGPFVFESWTRDDRMVMRAFENYWGGRPKVDIVEFRPIVEDVTRLLALEAGEIDLYQGQVVAAEIPRLERDPNIVVQRATGLGHTYVGFNMRNPILQDVRVRQAISHLIPREAIVERVLRGVGRVAVSPISPDVPWFNPDVPRYDYDPERARALLEEAGLGQGIRLRLHTNENPVRIQIAEILQFEAQRVGIELQVTIEEFGAFIARILDTTTADYDLYLLGWTGNVDPNYAMYGLFHSQGDNNYVGYSNPALDVLLEAGRRVPPSTDESNAIYQEAQALLMADPPFAFINYTEEIGVHRADISGWQIHPYVSATFQDLHLVEKRR